MQVRGMATNVDVPIFIVPQKLFFLHFFRLGLYLFLRILKDGKDKRFDQAKTDPVKFFTFWTLQGNMENSQTSRKNAF